MDTELSIQDYANIMQIFRRARTEGLDEAAILVQLAQKVSVKIEQLQEAAKLPPPGVKE